MLSDLLITKFNIDIPKNKLQSTAGHSIKPPPLQEQRVHANLESAGSKTSYHECA